MDQALGFLAISAVVIVTPGPDTLLTVNHTLAGGRRAGLATAFGVANGQAAWTLGAAAGVSALLVASEPVFVAVKVAGAIYLAWIGIRTVQHAIRRPAAGHGRPPANIGPRPATAYWRGLLSNLGNPKMAVFFASLLPQFAPANGPAFAVIMGLGLAFCAMTLAWLSAYAVVVSRAGDVLRRGRIGRWVEAVSGVFLALLGIGLALEPRRG